MGESWRPLYRGPWQFLPIEVLKDKIVFGMDSGIAKGGIGIYHPNYERWNFIFLKWLDKKIRIAQISELKLLSNNIWISALGSPQAIVISRSIKEWYPLHIGDLKTSQFTNKSISEGDDFIVCSTGRALLIYEKSYLKNIIENAMPIMISYSNFLERVIGYGFTLKRKILYKLS